VTWDYYWRALWLATSSPADIKVIEDRRAVRDSTALSWEKDYGDNRASSWIGATYDFEESVWRLVAVPMARVAECAFSPCQRAAPFVTPGELGLGERSNWWHGRPACLPAEIYRPGGFPRERDLSTDRGSAGFTWRIGGPSVPNWPRAEDWIVSVTQEEFEEIRAAALDFYGVPEEDNAAVAVLVERIRAAVSAPDSAPSASAAPVDLVPTPTAAPSAARVTVEAQRQGGQRWGVAVAKFTGISDLRQVSDRRGAYSYSFVPTALDWTLIAQHTEDGITRAVETIKADSRKIDWIY
jgi:hypothetical protein